MRALIFFAGHVPLAIFLMNCGGDPVAIPTPEDPPNNPSGGSGGTGSGAGGTSPKGGSSGSGVSGSVGQGGSVSAGTAGAAVSGSAGFGQGGVGGAGGTASGGKAGSGTAGTGIAGTTPLAGTANVGGSSTGGTSPTGGAAGTTSTVTCETAFAVTMDGFMRAPVSGGGCWHGYAFGGGDATSTVTFPGGGTDFSKSMGVLKLSGTVGAATEENNYAGNVYFGVNLNQAASSSAKATVTPAGASLVVSFSGAGNPPMRIQLQAPGGDTDSTKRWCAPVTSSGTAIPYTMFMTECWDGGTQVAYAKQPIEAVLITIPGGAADEAFDVTLTGLAEM
jgi:hypothetical protein